MAKRTKNNKGRGNNKQKSSRKNQHAETTAQTPASNEPNAQVKQKLFRAVFSGTIEQLTAMHIGGHSEKDPKASTFYCDGSDRLTMRGTALAGAMIAHLRKMGFDTIPPYISDASDGHRQSRWRIHNLHPRNSKINRGSPVEEKRNMIGVVAKTRGAATEKRALLELNILPKNTVWPFIIEVDILNDDDGLDAEKMLLALLNDWKINGAWIGANAARGMGLVKVSQFKHYRLTSDDMDWWPDATSEDKSLKNAFDILADQHRKRSVPTGTITPIALPANPWHRLTIEGNIGIGVNHDEYGVDSLSLGDTANKSHGKTYWGNTGSPLLAPLGISDKNTWLANTQDWTLMIAMTSTLCDNQRSLRPLIPGSSLRGSLRHATARYLRGEDINIPDANIKDSRWNNMEPGQAKTFADLFGFVDELASPTEPDATDGALIVPDCVADTGDFSLAVLEPHAEDEFAGGVYDSGKFNRIHLMEATFKPRLIIEARDEDTLQQYLNLLLPVLKLSSIGMLDLGGGAFRGAGWPQWRAHTLSYSRYGEQKPYKNTNIPDMAECTPEVT